MRNFENGGAAIQIGIVHVLLNILSISLLSWVHDTLDYFEIQKEVIAFHVLKKINKMQVAG